MNTPSLIKNVAVFSTLLLSSCCPPSTPVERTPVEQYFAKHPGQREHYNYIYSVRVEPYLSLCNHHWGTVYGYLDGFEGRFGSTPGLKEFSQKIRNVESDAIGHAIKELGELERLSVNGAIYQYEWTDGNTTTTGLMVINKDGDIIKR